MTDSLRKLQMVELGILKEVISICERNDIKYFALGGTLLGAIRHKGFIPWDDDIDIGMPRPDYERFLSIAESEIKKPYDIYTTKNGKGQYSYYYARVVDESVKLMRSKSTVDVIIPAWIDIFPIDGVPDDEKTFNSWKTQCDTYLRLFKLSQFEYYYYSDKDKKSNNPLKIYVKKMFHKLHLKKLFNTKRNAAKLDDLLSKYPYYSSKTVMNYCGYWGIKEMFPRVIYDNLSSYPFEDINIVGPADYDFVLSQMYGDYMTPLPPADRDHHSITILEINDSSV